MSSPRAIAPRGPLDAVVRPPGSKSITNRALVCAALARGESLLTGALDSDDTRIMAAALSQLGIGLDWHQDQAAIRVQGCAGKIPAVDAELFVGNSGTTVRFLAALAALGHGRYRFDGVPRMRERPIQDLLDALVQLGVDAKSETSSGCPPVVIRGNGLRGGAVRIRGGTSSQFASGLLMAAPYASHDVGLSLEGELVSQPYLRMTLAVMSAFGVPVRAAAENEPARYEIPVGRGYSGREYAIEPDASAGSYYFAAAAIAGGRVTVQGLSRDSLQGDVAFVDLLVQMGCRAEWRADEVAVTDGPLHGIDVDMNAISDTVQTLGAVALFASGPTTIRGVGHIRHKETDRIAALAAELRKLGAGVVERSDGLVITPGELHGARIETYDDHRMAMSLALAGLRVPGVTILNPECTAKTYPGFWKDFEGLKAE